MGHMAVILTLNFSHHIRIEVINTLQTLPMKLYAMPVTVGIH